MNIYLDIDGVILANEANLAIGASNFIKYAVDNFDVYWLTTHCMNNDPAQAVNHIHEVSQENLDKWLKKIRPTAWKINKTEAIDFNKPFLWFDDDCFEGERKSLENHGSKNSWIEVNLARYPRQMEHELELLKSLNRTKI